MKMSGRMWRRRWRRKRENSKNVVLVTEGNNRNVVMVVVEEGKQ